QSSLGAMYIAQTRRPDRCGLAVPVRPSCRIKRSSTCLFKKDCVASRVSLAMRVRGIQRVCVVGVLRQTFGECFELSWIHWGRYAITYRHTVATELESQQKMSSIRRRLNQRTDARTFNYSDPYDQLIRNNSS